MNRALFMICVLAVLASCALRAQDASANLRLSGVINLPGMKCALLETSNASPNGFSWHILQEGQREGEVEVLEIHPETATVKLELHSKSGSTPVSLTDQGTMLTPGIHFEKAAPDLVMKLYGDFAGRTLLRHPALPRVSLTLTAPAPGKAQAAHVIEQALAGLGIAAIPDGERFMMVVPQKRTTSVAPRSTEIKPSGGLQSEILPVGAINFPGTDSTQVMQIYAELAGRKLDRSLSLPVPPPAVIRFQNQTPLSRQEVLYALDTLFAWSGIKMVNVGTDQIKAAPLLSGQ